MGGSEGRWLPAMRAALDEARLAPATGDVPVGAVVVDPDGAVLAGGRNSARPRGTPPAMPRWWPCGPRRRRAGEWRLDGHTLVVTLEPCTMCAGAAVLARVERLVFAAYDDKAGAVGSLWDVVRDRRLNHRPEVLAGVLAEESAALLAEFFARQRG